MRYCTHEPQEEPLKRYHPTEPSQAPRFAGVSTFLRLPHVIDPGDVDVAVVGLPFDTGVSVRAGARFGPKAVREGSLGLRPEYDPAQRVAVFERLSVVDWGDASVAPGFMDRSLKSLEAALAPLHEAGVLPLGLGGDRSVVLAELRAASRRHGPLALVQFDARGDTLDEFAGERYAHETVIRRAADEGLIDPARSTQLGLRGGLTGPAEYDDARTLGFEVVPWLDLAQLGTGVVEMAVERAGGKAFLTFDIGFVDPAYAPGVGAPEVGGPSSMQALALLRGCRGLDLAGADVVGVVPDLDLSQLTATLAATVAWEMLGLVACGR
jgi:agmatinase